jgi:hypothetical protein
MQGSSRVRSEASVSPLWCCDDSAALMPAGSALTTGPLLSAAPRRGLWQPSQVRRSPGRTWIQLVWVWMARPSASITLSASGTSAGTCSLKLPSGSIGA